MWSRAVKATQLWRLRGGRAVAARLLTRWLESVYAVRTDIVYAFDGLLTPLKPISGYAVDIRLTPPGAPLACAAGLSTDPAVDADRFRQGARRYAAFWNGRAVDLCWVATDGRFHDCLDGFTLQLGPKEGYFFDYRGIQANRPAAFSGFALWTLMAHTVIAAEQARAGGGVRFYSLVDARNRVSNAFHVRRLNAVPIGRLRTRRLFGKAIPLIEPATPAFFVRGPGAPAAREGHDG